MKTIGSLSTLMVLSTAVYAADTTPQTSSLSTGPGKADMTTVQSFILCQGDEARCTKFQINSLEYTANKSIPKQELSYLIKGVFLGDRGLNGILPVRIHGSCTTKDLDYKIHVLQTGEVYRFLNGKTEPYLGSVYGIKIFDSVHSWSCNSYNIEQRQH